MKDYKRDINGVLYFSNAQKEKEILDKRKQNAEIKLMRDEINSLKSLINKLISERNLNADRSSK